MRGGKRPGSGRKTAGTGQRAHIIQIRVSNVELDRLKRSAGYAGASSLSGFIRSTMLNMAADTEIDKFLSL